MKRKWILLILMIMVVSVSACGTPQTNEGDDVEIENTQAPTKIPVTPTEISTTPTEAPVTPTEVPATPTETLVTSTEVPATPTEVPVTPTNVLSTSTETVSRFNIDVEGIVTIDELETHIEEHLDSLIKSLYSRWETLSIEIDTYEKYCENVTTVSAFYETVIDETHQMCILLFDYSAVYARMILDADMSNNEKYKAIDGINDCLYDVCDEIHDEIYEGILDEMNDYFYEGILDDAQDRINYSDWYDVCSDEYSQWYDTSSEVYSIYYDAASDIYSFYYDLSGELYSGDMERTEKIYEKFLQKIDKAKGIGSADGAFSDVTFDITIRTVTSVEELETTVDAHVSECIQALESEWTTLSEEIDTYDKYVEKIDKVEEFHTHIEEASNQILVMICEYGVSYAELIMQSDSSSKDKYNDFEDLKDCIYEDACELVKDDIYDGILEDIKDYYYEGILEDAKDYVKYSDWSDVRSDAYSWWSDARSEVYGAWSDARGDVYSFFSDMRGELFVGDIDRANEILLKFKEKVDKMK